MLVPKILLMVGYLLLMQPDTADTWVCSCDIQQTCGKEDFFTGSGYSSRYNLRYKLTPVGQRALHGEGPFWDQLSQRLFFVDVKNLALVSYSPETDVQVSVRIATNRSAVSTVVRLKGTRDWFLVTLDDVLAVVRWNGRTTRPLIPKILARIEKTPGSVLNEGKADPANRLWIGSKGFQTSSNPNTFLEGMAKVYMLDFSGRVYEKVSSLGISNGMDWSPKADMFYLVDSLSYKVYGFKYNIRDGSVEHMRVIIDLSKHCLVGNENSLPDGLTVDEEGMLWLAIYAGQKVIRINPYTGKVLLEVSFPRALHITSLAFGGRNLDILFVTTSRLDLSKELEINYPEAGHLYMVTGLGVRGLPDRPVALERAVWDDFTKNYYETNV